LALASASRVISSFQLNMPGVVSISVCSLIFVLVDFCLENSEQVLRYDGPGNPQRPRQLFGNRFTVAEALENYPSPRAS
jgi:hypothetical protein